MKLYKLFQLLKQKLYDIDNNLGFKCNIVTYHQNPSDPIMDNTHQHPLVKIVDSGLYFIFSFHFILLYFLFFYFQNNSDQGLSVMLSPQSQIDGIVTRLIIELGRMKQKILEQSNVIQHEQNMLASYYTHDHLGQGAQQLARTMGDSI